MNENKLVILCGKDGKPSISTVFSTMTTQDSNLFVKGVNKKTNNTQFKLYTEQDVEKFVRINELAFTNCKIIRWGTRVQVSENNSIVYNTNKAIALASNKYNARKVFKKAGVRIPRLVHLDDFTMEDLPIIARPFQHKQGKDFVVIKDFGSFEQFYRKNAGSWYFSAYIEKDSEYRVHCAHGRILSIMKKPKPEDPKIMAWNHAVVDEAFEAVPWSEWNIDLAKEALRACKALELDFCALDIIVEKNIPYVLEANTCPSLTTSEYNAGKYAKYFDWLLRKDERREHWEFEEKKKSATLAWKDWMFEDREPVKQ